MSQDKADIFISYAHQDDANIYEEEGWVSKFHKHLEPRLKTILGDKRLKIWRDNELKGNDIFGEEIYHQLSDNVVLVCIYSPSYLNSPWCGREVDFFKKANNGDVVVGRKSRIFKVVKIKIDRKLQPEFMQKQLEYQFYGERGTEYDASLGGEIRMAYDNKLTDLANDIAELLKVLKENILKPETDDGKYVFLADSPDCIRERDEVKRELEAHGYTVLPDYTIISNSAAQYRETISELIDKSDFYVQLLGEEYGPRFADADKSSIQIQYELIAEKNAETGKRMYMWIQDVDRSGRMNSFLDHFYEDVDKIPMDQDDNTLVIIDGQSLGKLNFEIAEYIKVLEKEAEETEEPTEKEEEKKGKTVKKIFLAFHEKDKAAKNFLPLYKNLVGAGIEVKLPPSSQDAEKARSNFVEQAGACDGIVLFYGEGDDLWLTEQQKMAEEVMASGNQLLAIYKFPPETFEKEILESPIYTIIDGLTAPEVDKNTELADFINKVREK